MVQSAKSIYIYLNCKLKQNVLAKGESELNWKPFQKLFLGVKGPWSRSVSGIDHCLPLLLPAGQWGGGGAVGIVCGWMGRNWISYQGRSLGLPVWGYLRQHCCPPAPERHQCHRLDCHMHLLGRGTGDSMNECFHAGTHSSLINIIGCEPIIRTGTSVLQQNPAREISPKFLPKVPCLSLSKPSREKQSYYISIMALFIAAWDGLASLAVLDDQDRYATAQQKSACIYIPGTFITWRVKKAKQKSPEPCVKTSAGVDLQMGYIGKLS